MSPIILITGAGTGFGRGSALTLARRGQRVIASTETEAQASELTAFARSEAVALRVEKLDITKSEDRARAEDWEVDVLVNNAATAETGPLAEIPLDLVRANFETNVFGTLALTQGVVRGMLSRGGGKIVMVSSVAGRMTLPYLGPYCMTKHALEAASEVLRAELEPHDITVVVLEPGPYATGFNERMMASMRKWYDAQSLFASDAEAVGRIEQEVLGDQCDPQKAIETLVQVVLDPHPPFRICIPRAWDDKVRAIRRHEA